MLDNVKTLFESEKVNKAVKSLRKLINTLAKTDEVNEFQSRFSKLSNCIDFDSHLSEQVLKNKYNAEFMNFISDFEVAKMKNPNSFKRRKPLFNPEINVPSILTFIGLITTIIITLSNYKPRYKSNIVFETSTDGTFFDSKVMELRYYFHQRCIIENLGQRPITMTGIQKPTKGPFENYITPCINSGVLPGCKPRKHFPIVKEIFFQISENGILVNPGDNNFEKATQKIKESSLKSLSHKLSPNESITLDLFFVFNPYQYGTNSILYDQLIIVGDFEFSDGTKESLSKFTTIPQS